MRRGNARLDFKCKQARVLETRNKLQLTHATNSLFATDIRAASYGHTLGGPVGLALVEAEKSGEDGEGGVSKAYLESGTWEVE